MPAVKIGRRKIDMSSYLCNGCEVPCVLMTYPRPNHCPFGFNEEVNWVKKKMKIEKVR